MKKEGVKQYSLVDNMKYAMKMLMQKDKIVVFLLVIAVFIEMLISLVSVYFPKFVVEQVEMSVGLVRLSSSILLAAIIIGSLYFISKFINTKAFNNNSSRVYLGFIHAFYHMSIYGCSECQRTK